MPSSRKKSRDRHSRRRSRSRSSSRYKSRRRSRSRRRSKDRKHRRRSKNRSSSPSRRRSRSRSKSSYKKYSRSRSKSPARRRSRSRSRSPRKEKKNEIIDTKVAEIPMPTIPAAVKPPEVNILTNGKVANDQLMQGCAEIIKKRRERIERERALAKEKKAKELFEGISKLVLPGKGWNLDDEADDDDIVLNNGKNQDESEEDTLDKFMKEFSETNKSEISVKTSTFEEKKGATKIIKSSKAKMDEKSELGEVMEQNPDAMEYSTEEEEETLESMTVIAKKDKLPVVDHDKVYYQEVQTNFYIEVPELKNMTTKEVVKYRNSLGGIKIKGKDCPKPIKSWAHCGLTSKLMNVLKLHKFNTPTPIQCQAIPAIMSGRDVISVAKTGSGKTLAYLLPMLRHVTAQHRVEPGDGPIGLIMVPTRELAVQIYREISKLVSSKELKYVCIYGGTVISEQIAKLKNGADILVCTPGRMIDMMAANGGRVTNLRRCTFVVLDEADRMFDLGFEPQVMTILNHIRPNRQTVMFSATFPRKMEGLARKVLKNPIEVEVGGKSIVCSDVDQNALILDETDKFQKLVELLALHLTEDNTIGDNDWGGKVIVFVEKQENADKLVSQLINDGGYKKCAAVHGGVDQDDRDSFIANFKSGKLPLLIATSVAARGLDVSDLNLVVNYDCPNHYEDYVHRCGRTGRAGHKGVAYTFITPDQERYIGDIIKAFKMSGASPPEQLVTAYNEYKARMKSEDKKIFKSSGFKGKGFQFDEAESQMAMDKKKFAKDLNDSDDEGTMNLDDKITDMFDFKQTVKDVDKSSFNNTIKQSDGTSNGNFAANGGNINGIGVANASGPVNPNETITADPKDVSKRLEAAKNAAMKLGVQKFGLQTRDQTFATTEALFRRGGASSAALFGDNSSSGTTGGLSETSSKPGGGAAVSNKDVAAQMAQMIHSKLGYTRVENNDQDGDGTGENGGDSSSSRQQETIKKYEAELIINDFPNNVRYRLTNKETMSNLGEYYDVGISVRGVHMTESQKQKMEASGERPLYLCIEALSEMKITACKQEVKRLVKEELMKLQRSGPQLISKGRYNVL